MYFYVSMALREGVLLVNGSHIRAWWIQHHYWSALASLFMIALPVSSPSEWAQEAGRCIRASLHNCACSRVAYQLPAEPSSLDAPSTC